MNASTVGFIASVSIHVGLVVLVIVNLSKPVKSAKTEQAIPLNIQMFKTVDPTPKLAEPEKPIVDTLNKVAVVKPAPVAAIPAPVKIVQTPKTSSKPSPKKIITPAKKQPKAIAKKIVTPAKKQPKATTKTKQQSVTRNKKQRDPTLDQMIKDYQKKQEKSAATPTKVSKAPSKKVVNKKHRPTAQKTAIAKAKPSNKATNKKAIRTYEARLRQYIQQRKHYPRQSKHRHEEGTATVSFVIYADGRIEKVRLISSSSSRHLDQAAINTIKSISRKLPFPNTIKRKQWQFTLPIIYRLR